MKGFKGSHGHVWAHCLLLVRDNCTSLWQKELVIELLTLQNLPFVIYCVENMYKDVGGKRQNKLPKEKMEEVAVSSLVNAILKFIPFVDGDFSQYALKAITDSIVMIAYSIFSTPKVTVWESKEGDFDEWEKFFLSDVQAEADQNKQEIQEVQELISFLPEAFMREVMELRYIKGLSQREAAERLSVSIQRIKGKEQKALILLRNKLKK